MYGLIFTKISWERIISGGQMHFIKTFLRIKFLHTIYILSQECVSGITSL